MSIQFKSKLCIIQGYTQGYRQIRNIHKLRGRTKLSISNDFVNKQSGHTSSLWKPFTFTIVVRH